MNTKNTCDINNHVFIKANPRITLKEEKDRWGVLYSPDIDFSLCVNPECILLWKQMRNQSTVHDVTENLKKRFYSVPDSFEKDVLGLIEGLTKIGFVTTFVPDDNADQLDHLKEVKYECH